MIMFTSCFITGKDLKDHGCETFPTEMVGLNYYLVLGLGPLFLGMPPAPREL